MATKHDNGAPIPGVLKHDLITLKSNTIRCKNLATIVSDRKNVPTTLRQAKTVKVNSDGSSELGMVKGK